MPRFVLALIFLGIGSPLLAADATSFGKNVNIPANTGFATNVSPDGQAVTVLFDDMVVSVELPRVGMTGNVSDQTTIQTKVVTLNFPFSTDKRSVKLNIDVRGYRSFGSGATGRLVVSAGGTTHSVKLSETKKGVSFKGKLKDSKDQKVLDGSFEERVEVTVPVHAKKPVCQVTLFLVAEQDTDVKDAGGALLTLDTMDVTFATGAKSAAK